MPILDVISQIFNTFAPEKEPMPNGQWLKAKKIMITRGLSAVGLLVCSNLFMTLAWYGQVMFKDKFERIGLIAVIFISWLIAFFEYCFMVPANRLGSMEYGGPFSIWELKVIQEVVSLSVFAVLVQLIMKNEALRWNHIAGFACLILAVFFIFKK